MRFRRLAVITCAMGTLTVNINNTALNLALPQIRDDLGLDLAAMQWTSATYVLFVAALTMLGGALGDRFEKQTVLTLGLVIYTAGSAIGMLAPSGELLIMSRAFAAIGASVLVPVGLAALRTIAQNPAQLARYMSVWGLSIGLGMALGPVAGGMVTDLFGWRAYFGVMVLLGLMYLVAVRAFLPRLPAHGTRRIDLLSHLFLGVGMLTVTAFFIELRTETPTWIHITLGLSALVSAGAWIWRDRATRHPVIPPAALQNRNYSISMLIAFTNYLNLGVTLFVSALLLQDLFGLGPGMAGAASIPLAITTAIGAQWAGKAINTDATIRAIRTAASASLVGLLVAAVGTIAPPPETPPIIGIVLFVLGTASMGFGFGAANTPVNYLAMSSLPKELSGAAGSSASASRQLGLSTGIATGGLLLGIGVGHNGPFTPAAYLLPTLEIAALSVLLLLLPARYKTRSS